MGRFGGLKDPVVAPWAARVVLSLFLTRATAIRAFRKVKNTDGATRVRPGVDPRVAHVVLLPSLTRATPIRAFWKVENADGAARILSSGQNGGDNGHKRHKLGELGEMHVDELKAM